jgi:hypothetical protein
MVGQKLTLAGVPRKYVEVWSTGSVLVFSLLKCIRRREVLAKTVIAAVDFIKLGDVV